MKIIDISWPVSTATTEYKDKKIVHFEPTKVFAKDNARETTITLSTHTGTHVDAPAHFLKDGKTIDQMSPDRFVGPCKVLDLVHIDEKITGDHLAEHDKEIKPNDIILLKTKNSVTAPTDTFTPHFAYLEITGAEYLVKKQVKAVGTDYLGIEHSQPGHLTHTTLMHADITIIEGLRLQHVAPGAYIFVCLPLYLVGLDGAPARAILMQNL